MVTKKELETKNIENAKEDLRKIFEKSEIKTVYTILRHCSRSGMVRHISLMVINDSQPLDIGWLASKVLGWKQSDDGGINVSGCGMDMGFHLVYSLSSVLYPNGFQCIGNQCNSNDHMNGDKDYSPHLHREGGYFLKQRW